MVYFDPEQLEITHDDIISGPEEINPATLIAASMLFASFAVHDQRGRLIENADHFLVDTIGNRAVIYAATNLDEVSASPDGPDVIAAARVRHSCQVEGLPQFADIQYLVVDHGQRERRVGSLLMAGIAAHALEQRDELLHVKALSDSAGFYDKLGFSIADPEQNSGEPNTVLMAAYPRTVWGVVRGQS